MAIFAGKRVAQTGDAKVSDFKDFKEQSGKKTCLSAPNKTWVQSAFFRYR